MIITVTLNPAVDKTAQVERFRPGTLHRLENVTVDAGGKGVNVSKMIAALGGNSVATGFVGGENGAVITKTLDCLGVRHDFVPVAGNTRTNLKIIDDRGTLTEFNEPGFSASPQELTALEEKVAAYASGGALVVLSGSLPGGVDSKLYERWTKRIRQQGGRVLLDASGDAFRHGLAAAPDYIKPNLSELCEYFSVSPCEDLQTLHKLCRKLLASGAGAVILTMSARGAMFVRRDEAFFAPGLRVEYKSPVGAGDCMAGALAYAIDAGLPWREAMIMAMAASAGAVATEGTNPPGRALVEELAGLVELVDL